MAKNTDSSIKLLVLYDILLKSTDEEHALSTNEIIEELKKRGISVSRKVLPSDIDLLNKYGYEICSYVKKSRYYYAVHQLFDTAEITMLTDVIKASKLTETRKETIINKLYSTIGIYKNADNTDNIIFLDSKKHGNSSIRKQLEVDFVCNLGTKRYYIQSAYSLPSEEKRSQEIRPFTRIDDSFKKIVITGDMSPTYYNDNGVLFMNIFDFLLKPDNLNL